MPELPEVETVVRDLRPCLVDHVLELVEAGPQRLRQAWRPEWQEAVHGRRVISVTRRGKWIVMGLHDDSHLLFHLGMTGQLTVVPTQVERASHTHLIFAVKQEEVQLRFRDVRRFGCVQVVADPAQLEQFFIDTEMGPEPFGMSPRDWAAKLARTRRCLKAVLLDQRVVAGVGNIYADESLFEARLHPNRPARDLNAREADRLRRAVERVLLRAIDRRGSSIRDYIGGSGLRGGYQEEFRVYGRTGQPCRRCRTPIERVRLAGRSTHYCPRCQAMPT